MVINSANEEAQRLHQENPDGTPDIAGAIPLTEPNRNPNRRGLAFLEHNFLLWGAQIEEPKYDTGCSTKTR